MIQILNYFKIRREQKLRKWCIDKTIRDPYQQIEQAQKLYDWVISGQTQ